jgi:hypothetical protein
MNIRPREKYHSQLEVGVKRSRSTVPDGVSSVRNVVTGEVIIIKSDSDGDNLYIHKTP